VGVKGFGWRENVAAKVKKKSLRARTRIKRPEEGPRLNGHDRGYGSPQSLVITTLSLSTFLLMPFQLELISLQNHHHRLKQVHLQIKIFVSRIVALST
jgi:hypothetical protein